MVNKMRQEKSIINDIERRGDIANCIALHDFKIEKPDMRKWVEYVVSFFEKYDLVPNRISSPAKASGKNINFKNGIRQLEKMDYQVDGIWIGALPLEYKSDTGDALFSGSLYTEPLIQRVTLIFNDDIAPLNTGLVNQLALGLWKITGAQYGYFYQRSIYYGPSWYPSGVISGLDRDNPEQKQERRMITKWGISRGTNITKNKYIIGRLRDIYPIQFLTEPHLEWKIFSNQTLGEWIRSGENRGTLEQLSAGFWSWVIEESDISSIRETLKDSGIIVCV